jgi:hypothetical protein
MTHKESEQYRLKLTEIIKRLPKEIGEQLPEGLKEDLLDVARKVGACTRSVHIKDNGSRDVYNASTEDLISNIHQALNTATTIEMCRISARNFWVALVATVIALLAMFAAWAAVVVKAKGYVP